MLPGGADGRVGMLLDYGSTGQEFEPQWKHLGFFSPAFPCLPSSDWLLGQFGLSGSKSATDWHPVRGDGPLSSYPLHATKSVISSGSMSLMVQWTLLYFTM